MKLESGQILQLNGVNYRVGDRIGGGDVADVYRARLQDSPDVEAVIKMARGDASDDPSKLEGIRSEGKVLEALNRAEDGEWATCSTVSARLAHARLTETRRRIIALYDAGTFANGDPFLVQEMAPPTFVRFPIENVADEARMIAVAGAVAQTITRVHELGFALKDFEPITKGDRIRVRWLDPAKGEFALKIIDWNVTGGEADAPQDLVLFGRHLYYFLLGSHVRLDSKELPPADLEASSPNWTRIHEGSRQILRRALHRDPGRRYQRAGGLEADLTWWLSVLQIAGRPGAAERLKDRLWQARTEARHDRVLAVANLALDRELSGELSADLRASFERPQQQAREELEKEDWLPLADARSTLLLGAFPSAVEKFSQLLIGLSPSSEAARRARIFQCLAALGAEYGQGQLSEGLQKTRAWEPLLRAAGHLAERRWAEGVQALLEADHHEIGLSARQPFRQLMGIAKCGQLCKEANDKLLRTRPVPQEAERPDWAEVEQRQIAIQREGVNLLRQARDAAPLEPELDAQLQAEEKRLKEREAVFNDYQDADWAISSWVTESQKATEAQRERQYANAADTYERAFKMLEGALDRWERITDRDPEQHRARLLRDRWLVRKPEALNAWQQASKRAQIESRTDEALTEAKEALAKGDYSLAARKARSAAENSPDRRDVHVALAAAEAGERLELQARSELENASLYVQLRNLEQAVTLAGNIVARNGRSFVDLGETGDAPFVLSPDVRERATKILQIGPQIKQTKDAVNTAVEKTDQKQVIRWLTQLKGQLAQLDEELTDEELQQRARTQSHLTAQNEVSNRLDAAPTLEDLASAMEKLSGDESPQAAALRKRIGDAWDALAQEATDLDALQNIAVEGARCLRSVRDDKSEGDKGEVWNRRIGEVERLKEVQAGLEVTGDEKWPAWFDGDDGRRQLEKTGRQLQGLIQGGWEPVVRRARQLQEELAGDGGHLSVYAVSREKLARDQARRNEFGAAAETTNKALALFQSQPIGGLSPQLRDSLNSLDAALQARAKAEGIIADTLHDLTTDAIPPADADAKLNDVSKSLPANPDIPIADLKELLLLGGELSEARNYPTRELAEDGYARHIYEGQNLQNRLGSIQAPGGWAGRNMPTDMNAGIAALQSDIQKARHRAAVALVERLKFRTEELRGKRAPDLSDAAAWLRLHWQTTWLQAFDPSSAADLPDVADLPRAILDKAWEVFTQIKLPQDLEQAIGVVRAAARLNDGLLIPGEYQGLLPGLAEGKTLPVGERPLVVEPIQALLTTLLRLKQPGQPALAVAPTMSESSEGAPEPTGDDLAPDDMQRAAGAAGEAQACLDVLKGAIWAPQDLREWPAGSAPEQLSDEADLHVELVQALYEARRCLPPPPQPPEAIQGLAVLDARVAGPGNDSRLNEYRLWLLEPGRNALRTSYSDLRERLRTAIVQQVEAAFNEPVKPAQAIRTRVLEPVASKGVAELVNSAILEAVRNRGNLNTTMQKPDQADPSLLQRVFRRGPEPQRTAAQRDLWRIIKDATAPWASDASAAASEKKVPVRKSPASSPPPRRRGAEENPQHAPEVSPVTEPPGKPEVTPAEIAEVWRALHEEAIAHLKESPHVSRRLIAVTVASVIMIVAAAAIIAMLYIRNEREQQNQWVAQATGTAAAQLTSDVQIRQAQAIAATGTAAAAEANRAAAATQTERTSRQTQVAATQTRAAEDTATAAAFAATATAQVVAVQATEQALMCQSADRYQFELTGPEFDPPPTVRLVKGDPQTMLSATWVINNTGDCAMERVWLWSNDGARVQPKLSDAKGDTVDRIAAGAVGKITVTFPNISPTSTYKLTLAVNDSLLLIAPTQPQLTVEAAKWVVVVTPTPTPKPTHTPTATSTPELICRTESYECNCTTSQDALGNSKRDCQDCQREICETATPRP